MKKYLLPLLAINTLLLFSCKSTETPEVVEELPIEAIEVQVLEPVKWTYNVENTAENEYKISFTATVEDGWYVYSSNIAEDGPIPTGIYYDASDLIVSLGEIEESGEVTKDGYDEMFDMDIKKFGHAANFSQVITTTGSGEIAGYLEFMTCDSMQCLFPDPIEFVIEVK